MWNKNYIYLNLFKFIGNKIWFSIISLIFIIYIIFLIIIKNLKFIVKLGIYKFYILKV